MQCRVCLSSKADAYVRMDSPMLEGADFYSCFCLCTQLEASPDDELPGILCTSCSNDLHIAFNFVHNARQADVLLRNGITTKVQQQEVVEFQVEENSDDGGKTIEGSIDDDECVVEELLDGDLEIEPENEDGLTQIEIMEVKTVDEIEDPLEELDVMEEKSPRTAELQNDFPMLIPKSAPIDKDTQQMQYDCEFYAEDEADDEYLIEFIEIETLSDSSVVGNGSKWKCIDCKRILRGDVSYEGHMNMHRDIRPYKCSQCLCAFRCKNALERHTQLRHNSKDITAVPDCTAESLFACNKCSKNFDTQAALEEHLELIHPSSYPVQCKRCPKVPPFARSKLAEHYRIEHPIEYRINFPPIGQQSNESVTNERPHECQFCFKRFATASYLRKHIRGVHPEEYDKLSSGESGDTVVQCDLCKKQLLRRNFEKHMALHEKKEREANETQTKYLCAFCSEEFGNNKNLMLHEENVHLLKRDEPKYECGICLRKFSQQWHLATHIQRVHTTERRHICNICGNAFKTSAQVTAHKLVHKKKSYECIHCHKQYTRKIDLDVHMRSHTGERPYACHLCDKRFTIRVRLTYHLQKHEGIKHQCPHCTVIYNSRNQLKEHLFKHTGMPYRCELCPPGVEFTRRLRFANHMRRVHNKHLNKDELAIVFAKYTGKSIHFNSEEMRSPYYSEKANTKTDKLVGSEQ